MNPSRRAPRSAKCRNTRCPTERCEKPTITINGQPVQFDSRPLTYVALHRDWTDGDAVTLQLPMKLSVHKWPKNKDAVSIDYGPLSFSLKIGERWSKSGGTDTWPETELYPASPWNFGLVIDEKKPEKSFRQN